MSHMSRIDAMQAAHRKEQQKKRAEEEEQRRLDAELFGEGDGDVQMTTEGSGGEAEAGGPGGELVLENPEIRDGEKQDTVMADAGSEVVRKPEEPEEPPRSAPDCFASAPEPGTIESDGCSTTISYSKRGACALLDKINSRAEGIAAAVTSYSDGFVALALISPRQSEGVDRDVQSAASLLFGNQKDANTGKKEPESAVVKPDPAMSSLGEDELALTGFYYGRKKVETLLRKLTLAEEPVAVITRTASEGCMTVFVVGKQIGSSAVEDAASIDISHEIAELQYSARMALIEIGGNYQALDSELESLEGSDEEDVKEELEPQSAGRSNPTARTGGAKGRGGARGKAKARGRK